MSIPADRPGNGVSIRRRHGFPSKIFDVAVNSTGWNRN
ncbi:MAG: hypothetical protein OJF62_002496 [Pseudolabrys sp.]|nr:hypothetical protein [Pseudolabrys sp.]